MGQRAGNRLGPYEIVGLLGAGGMGEVYRARDTRLDRDVAIKLLPEHLSRSAERRQRLAREARAISSLQHPNICALHDVGSEDGVDFLVMELLVGETLAQRLLRGAMPVREILPIAIALADALDKAHRKGLVHRDLTPGNVMLTRTGPKVLDFGLAKSAASGVDSDETASVSLEPITSESKLVGTFRYMAPEQIEGGEADSRSDLFAFGAVLYEMATGKRAFEGRTLASVIAAVLERDPQPVVELQPSVPVELERVIRICLAKDPDRRFQSARDVGLELERIRDDGELAGARSARASARRKRETLAWTLAAAGGLAAAALWIASIERDDSEPLAMQTEVLPAPDTVFTLAPSQSSPVAVSSDGRHLVWGAVDSSGRSALWVRSLDRPTPRRLEGTDGAEYPFWSPDARSIAFFADEKLKRIDASGGPVISLCDAPAGRGGAWNERGVILFAPSPGSALFRVEARGGEPARVTTLDEGRREGTHRFPRFLPNGDHFLYVVGAGGFDNVTQDAGLWLAALSGGEPRSLIDRSTQAEYADGYLLFGRAGSLMAQPFDLDRLEVQGAALQITEGLFTLPRGMLGAFSVSRQGTLAFHAGDDGLRTELMWHDRQGARIEALGDAAFHYGGLRLAPDQPRAVGSVREIDRGDANLWLYDLGSGARRRLTAHPALDVSPVWSPDGARVFFASGRQSGPGIYVKTVDSSADEVLVYRNTTADVVPQSVSPDGRFLAFAAISTHSDLLVLPLEGDREPFPFVVGEFDDFGAEFSPDGRWLAYHSDESDGYQVYVRPFPSPGGKWRVSVDGGMFPRWRSDSRELLFVTEGKVMAAAVDGTRDRFEVGTVRELFEVRRLPPNEFEYDVSADGDRFLVKVVADTTREPIRLIQNWTAQLAAR